MKVCQVELSIVTHVSDSQRRVRVRVHALIIMVSWTCRLLLEVGRSWEKRGEKLKALKSVSDFISAMEHNQAQTQDLFLKEAQ